MSNDSVKDAAYRQYKANKKKEQQEEKEKAKQSLNYNPLDDGPLSAEQDPLADVKRRK